MSFLFAIVGRDDSLLFKLEFGSWKQGGLGASTFREESRHMNEFILYSALDLIEEAQWTSTSLFLKNIDSFYQLAVSAYILPNDVKLLLLHDSKHDDSVRSFFIDAHDLYVKTALSPFHEAQKPVTSSWFRQKILASAKKYL